MISLTNKEKKLHREQKVCYISKKEFNDNDKKYYTGKKKIVIGLMKDELRGKSMTEFVEIWPKTYSYLMDDGDNDT